MSLQLNGTAGVTYNDGSNQPAAASPYGLKNLIINGDMRIAQRATSATITGPNAYHTVDRFIMNIDTTIFNSIATMGQNLDSLTPPSDFSDYVGIQINTGTALSGNPYYNFRQQIEGNNVSHLKFGTANAKTITVSFWVRSSLTGNFSFSLRNVATNRSYVTTYNIASANTWEKKTITITGDTTGTWAVDNTIGLTANWGLGNSSGSFSTSTLNEWLAGSYTGATTGVDLVTTTNAKWYITGVQLEVGDTATPFENRMYGTELALCQRYFCKSYNYTDAVGTNTWDGTIAMRNLDPSTARTDFDLNACFPVEMRANPTITAYSKSGISGRRTSGSTSLDASTNETVNISLIGNSKCIRGAQNASGVTAATFAQAHYTANSEL
jgi:hypothetical protein